jgi:hypothetical protein
MSEHSDICKGHFRHPLHIDYQAKKVFIKKCFAVNGYRKRTGKRGKYLAGYMHYLELRLALYLSSLALAKAAFASGVRPDALSATPK